VQRRWYKAKTNWEEENKQINKQKKEDRKETRAQYDKKQKERKARKVRKDNSQKRRYSRIVFHFHSSLCRKTKKHLLWRNRCISIVHIEG
jgi:hypothetical protein